MAALPLKHRVLVTEPLSDAAITRLTTFFEVETRHGCRVPSNEVLVGWLHGKAGVIADSRFVFDAELVSRLPTLKAVCNLDAAHHNLDLPALTKAGIRATHTPEPDPAAKAMAASAQCAWQAIQPLLARAAAVATNAGQYGGWSRKVVLGQYLHTARLGILSGPSFVKALLILAQSANVRVDTDRASALARADVLVIENTPTHGLSADDRARMKHSACVFILPACDATVADLPAPPWTLLRSDMAAESMVASLGFGRNSWHPPHLLNPDIACDSCC